MHFTVNYIAIFIHDLSFKSRLQSFFRIGSYGVEPREGKPTYQSDSEVICTSFYSKLNPLEDGEVLYSHAWNPDKDQPTNH